jgi:hypothetical protein
MQLAGWGQIGVTTKTLAEISERLSRYLSTLLLVNVGFGLSIALGLWAIGLPYPILWGSLAGLLRFVPYVGTLLSFLFLEFVSIAHFPGWTQPLVVLALFALAELVTNSIEPLVYGKSAGISRIGLLVSALFWTWLWGPPGLLLANTLTVCLAVVGQYVPGLGFLGTFLRQNVEVADDLRWYQLVLERNQDGATALVELALKSRPLDAVCDQILIPALARAEHDRDQGAIEKKDLFFIHRVVRDWLDDLADRETLSPAPESTLLPGEKQRGPIRCSEEPEGCTIVGLAGRGGDLLILKMINLLLGQAGPRIRILSASRSPLQVSDRVGEFDPGLILISHLPSSGLTRTQYLIKKLRARYSEVPIAVGYWDAAGELAKIIEKFRPVSPHRVVLNVAAARSLILEQKRPESAATAPQA